MQRVYAAGVVDRQSMVSAKPAYIVDCYLSYGMIGIFVYVGVEVTIDNNFGALLKIPGYLTAEGLDESAISKYLADKKVKELREKMYS